MQKSRRKQTVDAWSSLADIVFVPHTEADQKLITLLDRLVDEVGENESHPLAIPRLCGVEQRLRKARRGVAEQT